jgi:hypothetical protein
MWHTAHWIGDRWDYHDVTTSDNNYDYGPLYIETDGLWRIIAPTLAGPQAYNPGGEVAMWISKDQGSHWKMVKQLTRASVCNNTYVRRPLNADPQFYALWADGNARQRSKSNLYFTDKEGSAVWQLPETMTSEMQKPEKIEKN